MEDKKVERVPCSFCGRKMLPTTAEKYKGLCALCHRYNCWQGEEQPRERPKCKAVVLDKYPLLPYEKWSSDERDRWMDAAHFFGVQLMRHARDQAIKTVPEDANEETRAIVAEAVMGAIGGLMQMVDGVVGDKLEGTGNVTYSIKMYLRDDDYNEIESFEFDEDGEGMCMGFSGWWENEFYWNRERDELEEL